ncbi:MAG: Gfo/Idh/MocA family protein [Halodesulfurarchaeum sp.]
MAIDVTFLGHRFMGRAHANALATLPMFFPDAPATNRHTLVGRDEEALSRSAERLGFAHTSTDWREAIDAADVLYNLAPNHLHAEPSIYALENDTHVLCEKPLARNRGESARMVEAARDHPELVTGTAFNYRFVPAIQYAKRLIERGDLGEIRHVRGSYRQDWLADPSEPWSWRLDEDLAGSGALGDLGAHTIDLVQFLVGDIERVSGHTRRFVDERPDPEGEGSRPVTVDDAYAAQAELAGGAMATLEATRYATGHRNDHTIEVHGSAGSIRFSLERLNELEVMWEEQRGFQRVLVTDEDDPYLEHWWPPGHVLGWEHTFVHENDAFLRAVAEGERFRPDFADGHRVQQVMGAIAESDAEEWWVGLG